MSAFLGLVPALARESIYLFYFKNKTGFLPPVYRDRPNALHTIKEEEENTITDLQKAQDPIPKK